MDITGNCQSDIWALGCLIYELLTGEVLFYSQNWIEFFSRVTGDQKPVLGEKNLEKINHNPFLIKLLSFLLVRDQEKRPDIFEVQTYFNSLFMAFDHK